MSKKKQEGEEEVRVTRQSQHLLAVSACKDKISSRWRVLQAKKFLCRCSEERDCSGSVEMLQLVKGKVWKSQEGE